MHGSVCIDDMYGYACMDDMYGYVCMYGYVFFYAHLENGFLEGSVMGAGGP